MKLSLSGLKAINENPETGFVQYENSDKVSWWMPEVFFKAWKDLDNMRRSRDYYKLERDNLKRLHEKIMNETVERVQKLEMRSNNNEKNLDDMLIEATFLRDELNMSERSVTFWKTVSIVISIFGFALFGLIVIKAL